MVSCGTTKLLAFTSAEKIVASKLEMIRLPEVRFAARPARAVRSLLGYGTARCLWSELGSAWVPLLCVADPTAWDRPTDGSRAQLPAIAIPASPCTLVEVVVCGGLRQPLRVGCLVWINLRSVTVCASQSSHSGGLRQPNPAAQSSGEFGASTPWCRGRRVRWRWYRAWRSRLAECQRWGAGRLPHYHLH